MTRRTARAPSDLEARLSHPAAQVIMRPIVVYAKRAARAYALCDGPGTPSWDAYYGLACTEEALRAHPKVAAELARGATDEGADE